MNSKQKNTALVASIASGLLSLPLPWMTIHNARVSGVFGDLFDGFPGMSLDVTGLNGEATLLFKTPLWFVICVAISTSILQLNRHSQSFAIPRFAVWLVAIFSVVWITGPVVVALVSGDASPGIGWLLAMLCAWVPLVCLFLPERKVEAVTTDSSNRATDQV